MLDAYAVLAYLKAEPAAGEVRALLDTRDATLTSVGIAEVLDHLVRLAGADEEDAALMADCIAAEAARQASRPLATSDRHLLDLCHAEHVPTIVLTASDGTRWVPSP